MPVPKRQKKAIFSHRECLTLNGFVDEYDGDTFALPHAAVEGQPENAVTLEIDEKDNALTADSEAQGIMDMEVPSLIPSSSTPCPADGQQPTASSMEEAKPATPAISARSRVKQQTSAFSGWDVLQQKFRQLSPTIRQQSDSDEESEVWTHYQRCKSEVAQLRKRKLEEELEMQRELYKLKKKHLELSNNKIENDIEKGALDRKEQLLRIQKLEKQLTVR